jgi:peptidoglycan/LPS O-acetylase OafA/YrhL
VIREQRLLGLDLLRGVAAITVAICHFMIDRSVLVLQMEMVSIVAVEIFFVLSGFVLAPQIVKCATNGDFATFRVFLVRRWMRTVPPYLLALLCVTIVTADVRLADMARYALYLHNLLFQANLSDYFPVAWSLSVEEWFYIAFPCYLILASRFVGVYNQSVLQNSTLLFVTAIILIRLNFSDSPNWGYDVRRVVVFRIDAIAYGLLLWSLMRNYIPTRKDVLVACLVMFVTAILCLLISDGIVKAQPLSNFLFPLGVAVFGCSTVTCFRFIEGFLPSWSSTPCLFFGRVSYSVYLFHLIIMMQVSRINISLFMGLFLFLVVLIVFAWAVFKYFETPFLNARPMYRD